MLRAGVVVALALLTCAPAQADPFESYDGAPLATCLESAGAASDAMRQCIGLSARACVTAEGGSTDGYNLCWSHEAEDWRARLDAAADYLNTNHTYRDPHRLANANKAWERWAEAECEYWAYEEGGGVGETVDRIQCWTRVTAERAITLIVAGAAP
jgi:uncharacterized protein YecT (DUF1311 family)